MAETPVVISNVLWIAEDESYGHCNVLLIDPRQWNDEDWEHFDNVSDSERWETAVFIQSKYR